MIRFKILFLLTAATGFVSGYIFGQEAEAVRVGVYESPPFVNEPGSDLDGMSIELWEEIGSELNLDWNYQRFETLQELVSAAHSNQIDLIVTNLTIEKDRALLIDFTQPWYDAGLRILVNEKAPSSSRSLFKGLIDAGHIKGYLWIIFVIALATIGLCIFDRKYDPDFPKQWREGLAESFYTVMSVATSGSLKHKNLFGWRGKILSAFWLVVGIVVLAYITSTITSVMTTLSITNDINSINVLQNQKVAVFSGGTSEAYAKKNGMNYKTYSRVSDAVQDLRNGTISAIIGDAPVLEYYAYRNSEQSLRVVGKIFKPEKYGFGLPYGSPLTDSLTIELLSLQESGFVRILEQKYFGDTH